MLSKERIIAAGKYLFLAGVALLIVRNNSYPFLIKRSSDILFALSFVAALWVVFRFKTGHENFIRNKNILSALLLICFGLLVSSLSGYFSEEFVLTKEGLLNIGRFTEIFTIIFLVSFFQSFDVSFYKKAALAQLSTLAYLPMLFLQNTELGIAMYRFQLFENWPSNVGYYLIVSLTCVAILALQKTEPFKKIFWPYYAIAVGLAAILLWTQSRAAWFGIAVSILLLVIFWARENYQKITAVFFLAALVFAIAFLLLQPSIQKMIAFRILPQSAEISPAENTGVLESGSVSGILTDPHRLKLWQAYYEKLLESPFGFGINYEPIDLGAGKQGPHNTILEFFVLAGPIGLAGFAWLIFLAFKNVLGKIRNAASENRIWFAYIFSSLAGLIIASMFDNMSLFRLIWMVMGMAIFV